MGRLICIAIALIVLSGCAHDQAVYAELGAGKNMSVTNRVHEWEDSGGVGFYGALRYERPINEQFTFVGQYAHYSQWDVGPPWNNLPESSLDHVGVALRFKLLGGYTGD